ncbi:hypothetical protein LC593_11085 [Nostoc sp. CHAB 5844]|nr:hypothetical protein [Nostoc sp. CHAB 5844]
MTYIVDVMTYIVNVMTYIVDVMTYIVNATTHMINVMTHIVNASTGKNNPLDWRSKLCIRGSHITLLLISLANSRRGEATFEHEHS